MTDDEVQHVMDHALGTLWAVQFVTRSVHRGPLECVRIDSRRDFTGATLWNGATRTSGCPRAYYADELFRTKADAERAIALAALEQSA